MVINWPFVLLGEGTRESEEDPPGLLAYHTGGFTSLTPGNHLIFFLASFYTTFGLRDVGNTMVSSIPP